MKRRLAALALSLIAMQLSIWWFWDPWDHPEGKLLAAISVLMTTLLNWALEEPSDR